MVWKNSIPSSSPISNNRSSTHGLNTGSFRAIIKKVPAFYPQNLYTVFILNFQEDYNIFLKEGNIMKMSQAIKNFLAYQKLNSKKTPFKITGTSWPYSKKSSASGMYRK